MPLQNRVDPFGEIFATEARGLWMGNRGRLHDAGRDLVRRWAGKTWICCALSFNGRRRQVMSPDSYTELFFLDEPTAFAAGHRPCAECRRPAYAAFKSAFAAAQAERGVAVTTAAQLDQILHRERRAAERRRIRPADLPDGALVEVDGAAWLKRGEQLLKWTPAGYADRRILPQIATPVLTPPSTLAVLATGYPVAFHPTAERAGGEGERGDGQAQR